MKKKYITPALKTVIVAPAAMIVTSPSQIIETDDGLELQMNVSGEASIEEAV